MNIITIIGVIAVILTSISFLPQSIKTIRTKQVRDLSFFMYLILTVGAILWLVYGFSIKSIPIILSNVVVLTFSFIIFIMKIEFREVKK